MPRRRPRAASHGALLLLALLLLCTCRPGRGPDFGANALPGGRLPPGVEPRHYTLELNLDPARPSFSGRVRIALTLGQPSDHIWLHGRGLRVEGARLLGQGRPIEARYRQLDTSGLARVELEHPAAAGEAELELLFSADFNQQLAGLYALRVDGQAYAFTQFEPVEARAAFPCFDEPRFKTPFDIELTIAPGHRAISNTEAAAEEGLPDGRKRLRFATTEKLPTYLIAFAVGPLDLVEAAPIEAHAARGRPLPLRGVAVRGRGPQLAYGLAGAGPLLKELEHYLGLAYPYSKLDLIAVPDFGAGAMENAGAITFREWLLLLDAERAPEHQRRAYAQVMAHELAHHFFGNLVTMPYWDELWLNESFATWLGHRTVAAVHPDYGSELDLRAAIFEVMNADSLQSARRIRQPIASAHDISNAFDAITYQKGAAVLSMFEHHLGEPVFRRALQGHLERHAHAVADAADLLEALSSAHGKDLTAAAAGFLDQPGVPLLTSALSCDERGARLSLEQRRHLPLGSGAADNARWQIPVCVRHGRKGRSAETACTLLTEPRGELTLGQSCPDWVMPNAGAKGYYRFAQPAAERRALLSSGFAALTAAERLAVVDSWSAGFQRGSLSAAELLEALPTLAVDPERRVATAPMGLLYWIDDRVADDTSRPALQQLVRRVYRPRFEPLGLSPRADDDGEARLLRAALAGLLAELGQDRDLRRRLARMGRILLGAAPATGGRATEDPPAPELRDLALRVALQEGDAALFERALAALAASDDAVFRGELLGALGSVRNAQSPRALALTFHSTLRRAEVLTPLYLQLSDRRTRSAALDFLVTRFDAILEHISIGRGGRLPSLAGGFCSKAAAARIEALFEPRLRELSGAPRNLAAALEAIAICSAMVVAQRESATAFLASQPVPPADG
ncbi:MAG: M1 family metallopeptidase [Myxococcales bacterium]|nr:M1 family metallopeptidase [Myxococcales bacterium]